MLQDDEGHGNGAQSLDVGPMATGDSGMVKVGARIDPQGRGGEAALTRAPSLR